MYVKQEAVLSSQIEGTQSSLTDILSLEAHVSRSNKLKDDPDASVVFNYVRAMNFGIETLNEIPLSLRLIRMIHGQLLTQTRGENSAIGEFRRSQNWIGPPGASIQDAAFVPPTVPDMHIALEQLELFFHTNLDIPVLIHCALSHAQFETIHPFLDGNGRMGRLLITFQLVERKIISKPVLYLSHYFKKHRAEYYDRLMAVRLDGAWENWIKFFLTGVIEVSQDATDLTKNILKLKNKHTRLVGELRSAHTFSLLDLMYTRPIFNVNEIQRQLGITYIKANELIARFEALGIIQEITGNKRNRVYKYTEYLSLFSAAD